jgi:hypothetical protein
MFLAGGADGDFNVLTQSSKELHKASDGEVTRTVSHQQGDLRLLDAEDLGDLDLCHATVLEDGVDLQGELRLEQLLLRIGKAKICKDVAAALGYARSAIACFVGFRFHFSSAFLRGRAQHPRAAV